MNTPDTKLAPQDDTATPRKPKRNLVIGGAVAAVLLGMMVIILNVPGVNLATGFQGPVGERTDGYNITNNSGAILIFHNVGGHVGAPLSAGGAWLPGQTLNFEVDSGNFGWDWYTGDAFFEAYTVGDPNNTTDAGTVDVHFNTNPGDDAAMAYLNPAGTAPLVASAVGFPPVTIDGETWTMNSGSDNRIASSASATYDVSSDWTFQGVTADQLRTSVTAAKDATCSTPTNCTLGNTSWSFE